MTRYQGRTQADEDTTPGQALFRDLMSSSIVLAEDYEKLPRATQDELAQVQDWNTLLARLVEHDLLTPYQAERVREGKTYGLILGQYRVLDRLGAGGMGVVFRAEHIDMRRQVAVKVLSLGSEHSSRLQRRFITEIRVVARLQHPNIVAAMDSGRIAEPDAPALRYLVMELVPGQDLEEYVQGHGPLTLPLACDVIHQIAAALAEAHKHQLVHRDIKPSNIRLTPEGQAKLLDFGLARHFDHRLTEVGTVLGTLDYMAPEQITDAGSVDIRADIYALGGTLYWCLTGQPPFASQGTLVQAIAYRHAQPPPSLVAHRPDAPRDLDAVIARMMALQREQRFATPQAVMDALLPFLKPDAREAGRPRLEPGAIAAGLAPATNKHRVLIVDDEGPIRLLCRHVLETLDGPQCAEAGNGRLALETARQQNFDLVLTDIDMPEMGGAELVRRLRDQPPCPNLKVIMMSGRSTPDEMAHMLGHGADDYIPKPLSIVQLHAKVKAALDLKDAQDRADLLNSHLLALNRELELTLNARSSDLVQARNGLVRALAKLVEHREGRTGSHLLRMEQYARYLAEIGADAAVFAGQIDANFIDLVGCCAPLHDIGKVGLPDHILLKPGKLDADERLLMQTHTTIGADTLKSVMKQHPSALAFLNMAADIARHHHERFDGAGYPDRLLGAQIPLAARLVTIADVYDALRTRRPYKPALSHPAAVQVIAQVSAEQFDPNLLQLFAGKAARFDQIFGQFGD
jgi:response regulator RpfG family c-di-GMP phosphodiesterase